MSVDGSSRAADVFYYKLFEYEKAISKGCRLLTAEASLSSDDEDLLHLLHMQARKKAKHLPPASQS